MGSVSLFFGYLAAVIEIKQTPTSASPYPTYIVIVIVIVIAIVIVRYIQYTCYGEIQ